MVAGRFPVEGGENRAQEIRRQQLGRAKEGERHVSTRPHCARDRKANGNVKYRTFVQPKVIAKSNGGAEGGYSASFFRGWKSEVGISTPLQQAG